MNTVFVDSNIFIYAFIDKDNKGKLCRDLLDKIARGELKGITTPVVIDELVWILLKNGQKAFLQNYLDNLYELPNLEIADVPQNLPLLALEFILQYNLRPHDAMHCAFMKQHDIITIATNDKDFDKIKGINRMQPMSI